jgi:hypothetical protein
MERAGLDVEQVEQVGYNVRAVGRKRAAAGDPPPAARAGAAVV